MTPRLYRTLPPVVRQTTLFALAAGLAACGGGGGGTPAQPVVQDVQPPWTYDEIVAAAPEEVRLMPLGDSIVAGFGSVGGWRLPLFYGLDAAGIASIRQVGQKTNNWPTTLPPAGHEGHGGWTLADLIAFDDGGLSPSSTIESILEASQPSLILLHAGTNDAFETSTWQLAAERLEELLDRIEAWDPNTTVSVALVIPTGDPSANLCIDWINAQAEALVAARSQTGSNIQLVDMREACPEFVSGDGSIVHPNFDCYIAMGSTWLQSLEDLGTPVASPAPADPVVAGLTAFASSVDLGYLPDFAVSAVGLLDGLHAAQTGSPLGWRSQAFDQVADPEGQAVPVGSGPSFELLLPVARDVTAIEFWNGRVVSNGGSPQSSDAVRQVAVETSADGIIWTPRGTIDLVRQPNRTWTPPQTLTVDWPGTTRVRLTVTGTYADVSSGSANASVGLAEIQLRAR
ncbi:MAG: GDSL-type esterase/lipase family protein [Planctomycetota bacterium]